MINKSNFKFKGIGYATVIIVFLGNVYYEVILAWTLRYLFDSFQADLPWKYCSNKWNTNCCQEKLLYGSLSSDSASSPILTSSLTPNEQSTNISKNKPLVLYLNVTLSLSNNCTKFVDPITEYWE